MLRKTKVCQFDMPVTMDEHILWFQVSIQDLLAVEIFDGEEHFSGVKQDLTLCKAPFLFQVEKERATALKIKQQEQL